MKKNQPTRRQKTTVTERRKVGDRVRAWLHERELDALERREKEHAAASTGSRGVDRVPDRLRGLAVTQEPYLVGKHGTKLAQAEDVDPAGNYSARRARGERGKPSKIRRRDMPVAEARRIERNRKAWLS